ncbi:MAG: secA translation cis-regulator SecM [Pasteurellaceae bacterium]|nr:secA translation cis-regulator SecM [Pasteurellaceae bacterium]
MGIFRQLHKSAFWSQLLLGMLAVLSLPEAQAVTNPAQPTIQQSYHLNERSAIQQVERQAIHFLAQTQAIQHAHSQGVTFCRFLARSYPLQSTTPPPIRAGPLV